MNKYFLLCAAAALSLTSPAIAGGQHYKIHFFTGSGSNSYCDGMAFHGTHGKHVKGTHLNEDCAGTDGGVNGKSSKSLYMLNENFSTYSLVYEIQKPVREGGSWDVMICPAGSSCFAGNSGIYKLGFDAPRSKGNATSARVRDLIAAHRQEKRK